MQKDGQCSPEANPKSTRAKSCAKSSCLFSRPSFLFFVIPFLLTNLVYQAGGSAPNTYDISQLAPGVLAGLISLWIYGLFKLAKRASKRTSIDRNMPILADYMRRTDLTISQLDLDENSALTPGSKEN